MLTQLLKNLLTNVEVVTMNLPKVNELNRSRMKAFRCLDPVSDCGPNDALPKRPNVVWFDYGAMILGKGGSFDKSLFCFSILKSSRYGLKILEARPSIE